ncbi:MAG: nucleoside triphosphate pyrophosphohydrolase, partial [Coprothermobacterota bacterium]|nr:nucleoside triphosphate pyrophosphohydrolase [Coprothermobacterota bacterium]
MNRRWVDQGILAIGTPPGIAKPKQKDSQQRSPENNEWIDGVILQTEPLDDAILFRFLLFMQRQRRDEKAIFLPDHPMASALSAAYMIGSGLSLEQAERKLASLGAFQIIPEHRNILSESETALRSLFPPEGQAFLDLIAIMKRLRRECPWDRQQTHKSLLKYLLEESWELADAAAKNDTLALCKELGDVLLQVVFHAVIAEEMGEFGITEVVEEINEKLVRRHPHVYGKHKQLSPSGVEQQWERIKDLEKRPPDELYRRYMPALARAERIQEVASHQGLDWADPAGVLQKLEEEVNELRQAIVENNRVGEELGDLFFTLVNLSRFLHYNPEELLHQATDKFLGRYQLV